MSVEPINNLDEFTALINSGRVVVIDFWATWCGPCRAISPVLEKLAQENAGNEGIMFRKVDVDDVPDVAQEVGIRAMPTFIVFKDGEKIGELVGANPSRLQALVQNGASLT